LALGTYTEFAPRVSYPLVETESTHMHYKLFSDATKYKSFSTRTIVLYVTYFLYETCSIEKNISCLVDNGHSQGRNIIQMECRILSRMSTLAMDCNNRDALKLMGIEYS
jgi:hypothetical protein